ncbi:MAG: hypothetical protein EHM20_14375 [Alphaproteobacteria bacterium]|nr:MAG: hypothetical protein EHM20_14375 [Alphaproteobacteria bacterium]
MGHWYFVNKDVVVASGHGAEVKKEIAKMKGRGLNYSDLYKVVASLDQQNKMSSGGVSILQVIDESSLSKEAKDYFKNSLAICEEKSFGINKADRKANFEGKYFKEILKKI